jgi:hypothetical protein
MAQVDNYFKIFPGPPPAARTVIAPSHVTCSHNVADHEHNIIDLAGVLADKNISVAGTSPNNMSCSNMFRLLRLPVLPA